MLPALTQPIPCLASPLHIRHRQTAATSKEDVVTVVQGTFQVAGPQAIVHVVHVQITGESVRNEKTLRLAGLQFQDTAAVAPSTDLGPRQ